MKGHPPFFFFATEKHFLIDIDYCMGGVVCDPLLAWCLCMKMVSLKHV